ncbi:Hypothetical predicted protein [Cloeon dipterum]|uniref:WIF domain-containing protein n=1 Tax=Cloeon dipterum TaxID=197152 RepID=A0A8S1DDK2_9INSE|nr:Hypothetical predicted protein [Cloeon dipterum]
MELLAAIVLLVILFRRGDAAIQGTAALLLVSHEPTNRVSTLGLSSELYYIRDGVINQYALKFNVPVPANFTKIYFTWRSSSPKKVSSSHALI